MQEGLLAGFRLRAMRRNHAMRFAATLVISSLLLLAGCRKAKAPEAQAANAAPVAATASATPPPAPAKPEDPATRQLHEIGDKVAAAILAKDVDTLIVYDQNPDDQEALKARSGELYCYLFDTTCMTGKGRSVYDILTEAHQLRVDPLVTDVALVGKRYGQLVFYDKRIIKEDQLYSQDFLCSDRGLKQTASWHFIFTDGKWSTSTAFDFKVDRGCNP
jgi:hypothetical protein